MAYDTGEFDPDPRQPTRTAAVGMWLFLAALSMLFAASLVGYWAIRNSPASRGVSIHLPKGLFLSTALMLAASASLQLALVSIRRSRQSTFVVWLIVTAILAMGFLATQSVCLLPLLSQHNALRLHGSGLYGLVFFLIVLHALHVLGGLGALGRVVHNGIRGRYDWADHAAVRHATLYWHFLDVVWLVMFSVLWGLR